MNRIRACEEIGPAKAGPISSLALRAKDAPAGDRSAFGFAGEFVSRTLIGSAGALCLLGLGAGCTVEGTDPGELGNGAFTWTCAGDTDAWCETPFRHGGRPLPALMAPFHITYDDFGPSGVEIVSAAPGRLAWSRGRFAFLQPGPAALLARDASGTVRDFFHLQGAAVADLELVRVDPAQLEGTPPRQELVADPWALQPVTGLSLAAGQRATLFGYPVAADREVLTGSATWQFTVEPADVVALHGVAGDNVIEVEALAAGEAMLRARAGDVVRELAIHVEVGP